MLIIGILGLNYHLIFKGNIISDANASHGGNIHKIALCTASGDQCATFCSSGRLRIRR